MIHRLVILLSFSLPAAAYSQEPSPVTPLRTFHFGLDQGPTFRGIRPTATEQAFTLAGEYSALGWSFGFLESIATDANSSQTEVFAAYSYPLGWVEISSGLQTFLNFDTGLRDSLELFLEARTEPIYGFNFFLGQYFELTHGLRSYTEFKVSRRIDTVPNRFAFEPYALISFGNYNTDTYTFNHAQIGLDSEWTFSERASLGLYGGVVIPMAGVEGRTRGNSPQALAGFRLTYRF
jgi:hypothetical protein